MAQLAESLSLKKFIERHNDENDSFHLDEHQPVCCGYQFHTGVRFMNITTPHLLNNLARAENCGWQKQMHLDGAYNWCEKDFGIIGIGMNSMGSHFNPVSIHIVNSESKQAIECSFTTTIPGLNNLYQQVKLCDSDECGLCRQLDVQVQGQYWKMFWEVLTKSAAQNNEFPIDKPSSDRTNSFFSWCKDKFGWKPHRT